MSDRDDNSGMTEPQPTPDKKRKKWPIIVGSIVGIFILLVIIGAIVGPQEETDTTAQATTTAAAPTTTVAAAAPTSTDRTTTNQVPTTTTTTMSAAAPAREVDPRCAPADEAMIGWIAAGLTDSSLTLTNATVIEDEGLLFIGATTVRPDGKFENRSDVWIVRDSLPFSSTGGARSTTEWPKASDMLGISPSDERVQAVDACVVELTRS